MQWTHDIPRNRKLTPAEMHALNARIRAHEIRLNTAPYVGRQVQIFLALPIQIQGLKNPAGMRLEWQTRGPFSAGTTQPGSRSLIYQGPVSAAVMTDIFDFTLHIDGQSIDGRLQFDPQFELEILKNGYPLDARFAPAQKCRWPSRYFQIREEPFSRIYGHVLRWQT